MPLELTQVKDGVFLSIRVVPGSKVSKISGLYGSGLKVKIKSPPLDNRANDEVVGFLADYFNLSRSDVRVVKGERSRSKTIFLAGLSKEFVSSKLNLTGIR